MAYRFTACSHLALVTVVAVCILSVTLPRGTAVSCTASGLASGLESCLSISSDKDDCCDYVINDIVYPCGITEICGLDLGPEVREFFDYCRFKCHGLSPLLTATS